MPSITGGDSSARDYAPHMWVLSEVGDYSKDEDYIYVGNSTVYYHEPEAGLEYHVGVTALGELVGSVTPDQWRTVRGLPTEEIPDAAKKKLIEYGLRKIGTLSGHLILGAFGVNMPQDLEPIDFGKAFNGAPEEQEAELAKEQRWNDVKKQLRHELGII